MKVEPVGYSQLDITPENDAERIYLAKFLSDIPEKDRKKLDYLFTVDLEDMCVDENNKPMVEKSLEDVIDEETGEVWGMVERIRITPMGW